jgi:hypothetical protein
MFRQKTKTELSEQVEKGRIVASRCPFTREPGHWYHVDVDKKTVVCLDCKLAEPLGLLTMGQLILIYRSLLSSCKNCGIKDSKSLVLSIINEKAAAGKKQNEEAILNLFKPISTEDGSSV